MIYDDKKFIGEVIKKARKKAGLKQAELAEKIEMCDKNLGNIENGKQFPQLNNFFRILEILNLSVADFCVKENSKDNVNRNRLLQELYLLNDNELENYIDIINSIKKLVNKK